MSCFGCCDSKVATTPRARPPSRSQSVETCRLTSVETVELADVEMPKFAHLAPNVCPMMTDLPLPVGVNRWLPRKQEGDDSSSSDGSSFTSSAWSGDEIGPSSGYVSKEHSRDSYSSPPMDAPLEAPQERKRMKPLMTIEGAVNQVSINSRYSGAQCTSIALTALGFLSVFPANTWTPDMMNLVIWCGNAHHEQFRDVLKFSNHSDNRVALDELPSIVRLNIAKTNVTAHIGPCTSLFLKNTDITRDFECSSLYNYLRRQARGYYGDLAGVITCGDFSYSYWRDQNQCWYLFDSHGHLKIPVTKRDMCAKPKKGLRRKPLGGATLTKFTNSKALVKLLLKNHAEGIQVDARTVTPIPNLNLSFAHQNETSRLAPSAFLSTTGRSLSGSVRLIDLENESDSDIMQSSFASSVESSLPGSVRFIPLREEKGPIVIKVKPFSHAGAKYKSGTKAK